MKADHVKSSIYFDFNKENSKGDCSWCLKTFLRKVILQIGQNKILGKDTVILLTVVLIKKTV